MPTRVFKGPYLFETSTLLILCADEASLAMKIMVRVLGNSRFNTKSELLYTLEGIPIFCGLSSKFPFGM